MAWVREGGVSVSTASTTGTTARIMGGLGGVGALTQAAVAAGLLLRRLRLLLQPQVLGGAVEGGHGPQGPPARPTTRPHVPTWRGEGQADGAERSWGTAWGGHRWDPAAVLTSCWDDEAALRR